MTKNTLSDLVTKLNALRKTANLPPLKLAGTSKVAVQMMIDKFKTVKVHTVETVPSPHDDAAKHLAKLFGGKPVGTGAKAATKKSGGEPVFGKAAKTPKVTVSTVARELIVAGKTNDEVWSVISKQFSLDAGKRGYPAWYRSDCKKKGLIK